MESNQPNTNPGAKSVTNILLIPDDGDPNRATVASLQDQIIAIVTDVNQQQSSTISTPISNAIFQNAGQSLNQTFTQGVATFQNPLNIVASSIPGLPANEIVNSALVSAENSGATLAAFEAISVLADASNQQVREADFLPKEERKVFSSVKACLSSAVISEILKRGFSLEVALTNIATRLMVKDILCEFDEGSNIYTLCGDIKELRKIEDVLEQCFDPDYDFNQENFSQVVKTEIRETRDVAVSCDFETSVAESAGHSTKTTESIDKAVIEKEFIEKLLIDKPLDADDMEYADDADDADYDPTNSHRKRPRRSYRRIKPKKSMDIMGELSTKTKKPPAVKLPVVAAPGANYFTNILNNVAAYEGLQNVLDDTKGGEQNEEQHNVLDNDTKPQSQESEDDIPAESNDDVANLLNKPLDDDMRKYIIPADVDGAAETEDFAKLVGIDAAEFLNTTGTGDKAMELPPVTLSDEEALAEIEREKVTEKIRVAKEKVAAAAPLPGTSKTDTKPRKRKDYDALMPFKFTCTLCSFKTKRESHFIKHMNIHQQNPSLPILKCSSCDFKTIRQCHMKRHQAEHTSDCFHCEHCSYTTVEDDLLKKHVAAKHGPNTEKQDEEVKEIHQCPQCDYRTTRPYHFQRHLRVHADILGMLTGTEVPSSVNLVHSYQCPKCSYSTKKKEHFVRHLGDVHSQHRPFLCDTCGKSFKRADALKQHREVHMEKNARLLPFTCHICGKHFKSRAHLNDHKTAHTNVRAYLCEICGASFKTKSVQRKHVTSIHRNPRSYRCPHCDKRFNTKFALQRHSSTHVIPDTQIRTADIPVGEKLEITEGTETQYIQVEVNSSPQLTTIQTIPIMQMEGAQDVIMKTETLVEQAADGAGIPVYTQPGEATTALLYLTGNFPGTY